MLNLDFQQFPEFSTNRLFLRQIRHADAHDFFILRSNDEVMLYMESPKAHSKEEMAARIVQLDTDLKSGKCIQWAITLKQNPRLIGTICLWNIDRSHHRAEIGYKLLPHLHRKGLIQEALRSVINFGFETINLHSIEGQVTPQNIGSIKVLERNGFIREAYYKENYFWEGKYIDTAVYSLLQTSWSQLVLKPHS